MRIAEFNFERGWRGGERQTMYNMQGFRDAGEDVLLVCRKGCPLEKRALQEKFMVYGYANIFGVIRFLLFNNRRYDIIHAQTSHILTYCLLTKPFHRKKIIFSRRVDFIPKGNLTKIKYRRTDKLVAISSAVKQIVSNFCGRQDVEIISDIAVARDLNRERVLAEIKELALPKGTRIIGTTAALVPHKDPLIMVEAIKELVLKRIDFVFLHFGTGELEEAVRLKVKEYNLGDYYKLMGYFADVEDFFSVFEVFVMSSQEEGLGSSVLDAFLYRVPVVSTNAGGLKDLVTNERGVVCGVKDYKALAEGINLLLKNRNYQNVTENALLYVQKYHNVRYITRQYLSLMHQLFK